MKTAILILAAGSSSRMGKPKQLLTFKNTTLLGNAIEQAKNSKADSVFCVLGANVDIIQESISNYKIQTIFNPNFKDGLSSSIVSGIHQLKNNFEKILIILADQPYITSENLNQLLKASEENTSKIIAAAYDDKAGVPAVFPKNYFQQLLNLQGDKGAKFFLEKHSSEIIKMKITNLVDIDTSEDYKNLINNVSLS